MLTERERPNKTVSDGLRGRGKGGWVFEQVQPKAEEIFDIYDIQESPECMFLPEGNLILDCK